jgi:multiple sugar transport system ATP-binding protein
MIYVTHDQIEAMTLADRIAVMRGGIIQQLDAPHAIYARPVNRFVAGFIGSPGMNFLDGALDAKGGEPVFAAGDARIPMRNYQFENGAAAGRPAVLGVRPEHVAIGDAAAAMPFSADAEIEIVEPMGSDTLAWTSLGGQNLSMRIDSEKAPRRGERVRIGFDPARASVFDAGNDKRL